MLKTPLALNGHEKCLSPAAGYVIARELVGGKKNRKFQDDERAGRGGSVSGHVCKIFRLRERGRRGVQEPRTKVRRVVQLCRIQRLRSRGHGAQGRESLPNRYHPAEDQERPAVHVRHFDLAGVRVGDNSRFHHKQDLRGSAVRAEKKHKSGLEEALDPHAYRSGIYSFHNTSY